jgi:hypothetical protein
MRPSRKVWLIVGIIILVGALAGLYTVYSRQAAERGDLSDRLSRAQTLLPGLVNQREELEDELAQAESVLEASAAQFPESVESIEYDDDLFEIADDCNVAVTKITASPPSTKKVGTVTYSTSPFVVVVHGSVDNILDFIYALRVGDDFQLPWSAEVRGVTINVDGGTATINVDIYGYKGK